MSFVTFLNDNFGKFRKKNKDKLFRGFYCGINKHWQEHFHPYSDKKIIFLMLIHLPERLLLFMEKNDNKVKTKAKVLWSVVLVLFTVCF